MRHTDVNCELDPDPEPRARTGKAGHRAPPAPSKRKNGSNSLNAESKRPRKKRSHAERKRREDEHWVNCQPQLRDELVQYAPDIESFFSQDAAVRVAAVQSRANVSFDEALKAHAASCTAFCEGQLTLTFSEQEIDYWGLGCSGRLRLRTATCPGCKHLDDGRRVIAPRPIQCGCFPSSPVAAQAWLDLRKLESCSVMQMEGFSMHGEGNHYLLLSVAYQRLLRFHRQQCRAIHLHRCLK